MATEQAEIKNIIIPDELFGLRIDKALAKVFDGVSRSSIQTWIKQGLVLLDDEVPRPRDKVFGGEMVEVSIPQEQNNQWLAQPIALDIIYQDEDMMVINKPAGLVVHPGAGNHDGTLLNGLLHLFPQSQNLPRAGIVHRLDKLTSGLMVVAKTEQARLGLIEQLADHSLYREYLALVQGEVISGSSIDEPIARDKHDRRKMTVNMHGKPAITHYRVETRYRNHTLLKVRLETGRTHQIRVHMNHIGYPLAGDPVYGRRLMIPKLCANELEAQLRTFKRQALHAAQIGFIHPVSEQPMSFSCPMAEDMAALLDACAIDNQA